MYVHCNHPVHLFKDDDSQCTMKGRAQKAWMFHHHGGQPHAGRRVSFLKLQDSIMNVFCVCDDAIRLYPKIGLHYLMCKAHCDVNSMRFLKKLYCFKIIVAQMLFQHFALVILLSIAE